MWWKWGWFESFIDFGGNRVDLLAHLKFIVCSIQTIRPFGLDSWGRAPLRHSCSTRAHESTPWSRQSGTLFTLPQFSQSVSTGVSWIWTFARFFAWTWRTSWSRPAFVISRKVVAFASPYRSPGSCGRWFFPRTDLLYSVLVMSWSWDQLCSTVAS